MNGARGWLTRICGRKPLAILMSGTLLHQQGFLLAEAWATRVVASKVAPVAAPVGGGAGAVGALQLPGGLALPTPARGAQPQLHGLNFDAPQAVAPQGPAQTGGAFAFAAAQAAAPSAAAAPRGRVLAAADEPTAPREIDFEPSAAPEEGAAAPHAGARGGLQTLSRGLKKALRAPAGLLRAFFDNGAAADESAPVAGRPLGLLRGAQGLAAPTAADAAAETGGVDAHKARLAELRALLGDGTESAEHGRIHPFTFRTEFGDHIKARGAGLEGFLFRKLEVEKRHGFPAMRRQLDDFFNYADALLAPAPGTRGMRRELRTLRHLEMEAAAKNAKLNELLRGYAADLREEIAALDHAAWGRSAHTYVILARGYNRLQENKNFFDSLDEAELARIQRTTRADEIWLVDIYEIGDIRRWGTGGGSPYAIKGYARIREELGGLDAYKRFIARAHAAGLRVRTDLIPNHTSLDSDLVERAPQAFFHILPPQHLSDEEIMMGVPRENNRWRSPFFYLIKTENYPGREGRETKVLIHHPRTDYGDVMWIDMAQIDYSVPEARAWMLDQVRFLFGEAGLDSVRRDMAYYVLNEGYYDRWLTIFQHEIELSEGWARRAMERMRDGFVARWGGLKGAEILTEISETAKAANPEAVLHDEAYAYFSGLSAVGSDGVYGKNTHEAAMGQVGLYDAMRDRNAGAVREALRSMAFRFWQRGAATVVNFIGNHDEMNPVDRFGTVFRAAAATALLGGPIITYNGQELGTPQREMLGDLAGSVDRDKAIPFDVPVAINWARTRPENAGFLKMIWHKRAAYAPLFAEGAMDVLEPYAETPIAAYTVGKPGGARALLVAANFSEHWAWGHFRTGAPVLADFGAWAPRADKQYVLRDQAHLDDAGRPLQFVYSGKQLLEEGFYAHLSPGDAHIFEIEEIDAGVAAGPAAAEVQGRGLTRRFLGQTGANRIEDNRISDEEPPLEQGEPALRQSWLHAGWDVWVERLVYFAVVPFLFLQLPQILANFGNLAADPAKISILPWIGYATGIIANLTLLTYFTAIKKKAVALVQAVGVITSSIVLAQIFAAGFMPLPAMLVMPAIVLPGLLINLLQWMGKLPEDGKVWKSWNDATVLLGLFALPAGTAVTFNLMNAYPWAVLGVSTLFALGGMVLMLRDRQGRLPTSLHALWSTLGAWLATMLFVLMPIPQIVNNMAMPENIAGIALGTLLLSVGGNILETTGAIFHKNRIWFTGSFWAVAVGGGAVLLSMYAFGALSPLIFWGFATVVPLLLLASLHMSARHHGESMPQALSFLWRGAKKD